MAGCITSKWSIEITMNIQNFPTTNAKILLGIVLVIATFVWIIVCDAIGHRIDPTNLDAIIGFVQIFVGIGALQFIGKRATTKADVVAVEQQSVNIVTQHQYDAGA